MLRSEVPWFPRFIRICRFFFQFMNELDRDGLQDMDYDVMKRVIQCEDKREVWSIINAYNHSSFDCAFKPTRSWLRDWCLLVRRPKKIFFFFLLSLKKREAKKMRGFLVLNGKTKTIIPSGVLFFYFFLSPCSLNRVS